MEIINKRLLSYLRKLAVISVCVLLILIILILFVNFTECCDIIQSHEGECFKTFYYNVIKELAKPFAPNIVYSIGTAVLLFFARWVRNRYYTAKFLGCDNNTPFYVKINYYENLMCDEYIYTRLSNGNNQRLSMHRYVTSYDDYVSQCTIVSYLNDMGYVVKYDEENNIHNDNLVAIGSTNPIFVNLVHRLNIEFSDINVRIGDNEYSHENSQNYCLIFKYHPESNVSKASNTWLVVGGENQYSTKAGAKIVAERNPYLMSKISIWKSWIYLHHLFHVRNIENMVILICCYDNNPDDCDIIGIWCSAQNGLEKLF